jgi:fumarate hydratase class I
MCQDTGIVNVFVEVGMDVVWEADLSLEDMINEGVRQAFTNKNNPTDNTWWAPACAHCGNHF